MTQPIGGVPPPNFTNLVTMSTVVFHMGGAHHYSQKIDPAVSVLAKDLFDRLSVAPVTPVQDPTGGGGGSGEEGHRVPVIEPDVPPVDPGEGRRYFPPISKNLEKGDLLDLTFRQKLEGDFKEIKEILRKEKILPPQKEAISGKEAAVEKVAESIEHEFSRVVQDLVKNLADSALSSLKIPAKELQEKSTDALSLIKTNAVDSAVTVEIRADSPFANSPADLNAATLPMQVSLAMATAGKSEISPESMAQQTVVAQAQSAGSAQPLTGQENLLVIASTTMIPLQHVLSKENVHSIAEMRIAVDHKGDHHNHHYHHMHDKGNLDALSVPNIVSPTDLQGLTIGLTLPLGLIPLLPPHVISPLDLAKLGHLKKEETSVGSIAQKSLHNEKIPQQLSSDTSPIPIPSDRTDLHRLPDGREISYLAQMAQMGAHGEKRVEDSAFRLPDGLKLDPGHRFGDLIAIAYLAALCGASSLTQIAAFVEEHEEWLGRHFDLRRGIPSPTIFMWLFTRIAPFYFAKIVQQHIECITNRKHGRRSPFNAVRMWETRQGILFGQSKTESSGPTQIQLLRLFDWEDATLILEPVSEPTEIARHANCRLLMGVDPAAKEQALQNQHPIASKSQGWNDAMGVVSALELTLYSKWTVGHYQQTQEGILKMNRTFLSNLPIDFTAWNTLFYGRTDIEEQTAWMGEGRFLSFGEVTISHAMDNFTLLIQAAYTAVLGAANVGGSVEQKRLKLWEDPDELMILIGY